jgi:hypothetical protein
LALRRGSIVLARQPLISTWRTTASPSSAGSGRLCRARGAPLKAGASRPRFAAIGLDRRSPGPATGHP